MTAPQTKFLERNFLVTSEAFWTHYDRPSKTTSKQVEELLQHFTGGDNYHTPAETITSVITVDVCSPLEAVAAFGLIETNFRVVIKNIRRLSLNS